RLSPLRRGGDEYQRYAGSEAWQRDKAFWQAQRRWYWYQRYHHLLVDGFSFPAITRQIAAFTAPGSVGKPLLSRLSPLRRGGDEYQRYAGSEAWQRDKAFWQAQR
ncbi:hypothetical protein EWE77_27935, partial [Klebsiella pneumoniae]|nr:hypothetical protein [Klebsiella pneumoniae]